MLWFPGAWTVHSSSLSTMLNVMMAGAFFLFPALLLNGLGSRMRRSAAEALSASAGWLSIGLSLYLIFGNTWMMVYPHRPFYELLAASVGLYPTMAVIPGYRRGLRIAVLSVNWFIATSTALENVLWYGGFGRAFILDVTFIANAIGIPLLGAWLMRIDARASSTLRA